MDPSMSTPGAGPSTARAPGRLAGSPAGFPPPAATARSAAAAPSTSGGPPPLPPPPSTSQPTATTSAGSSAAAPLSRPDLPHAASLVGPGPVARVGSGPSTTGLVANAAGPSTSTGPLPLPPAPPRVPLPEVYDPLKQAGPIDEVKLISEGVRLRVFLTLAQDQLATVKPDVTAFRDHEDVLRRLVPYHLWQIPEDDLHGPLGAPSRKGKGRARDWDVAEAEAEIEERRALKEAIGFAKRKRKLDERFAQLRQREGLHASPSGMAITLGRELVNDELPSIVKTRSEAVQARQKQTILDAQINQIRNPAPPPPPLPPARPPVPMSGPPTPAAAAAAVGGVNGIRGGPTGALPPYRPQQGYPGTPIYRPAPGGGTYQPSRPLPAGTPTSVPQARAPTSNTVGRGLPPSSRSSNSPAPPWTSNQVSRPSTPAMQTAAGVGPPAAVGRPTAPVLSPAVPPRPSAPIVASATTSAAAPGKPTININAPHSLSVPIAFLPNLQTAGILPDATATPPQSGLATDVHIDRDNVRFTVVLAMLTGERIKTLSEVLSLAHGAEAKKRAAAAAAAGSA